MRKKLLILLAILHSAILIFGSSAELIARSPEIEKGAVQSITIRGTIVSGSDMSPMAGVNVVEKGTQNGTITNANGEYTIDVGGPNSQLEFSFIGYKTELVNVAGRTIIDLVLNESIESLDELVVVGYGSSRRVDITGSVSTVSGEDIQKNATPSIENALQGRASGVYVTKSNGSPGEGASIYIRGPGTIGNSGPLWVVDGIPSEAGNTLDMSAIESINILKDASSAAIYGAKAANGVILVTTKRGKSGKTKYGFSSYYGITQPVKLPELVSAMEYAQAKSQSQINAGMINATTGLIPAAFYQRYANGDTTVTFPDGTPIGEGTDWMDVLFDNGAMTNYNFNASGGGENHSFYTSFDYLKEDGTALRSIFERFNVVLNSDYKIGKFITIGESVQLSMTDRVGADQITGDQMTRVNPFMPVLDPTRNLPYPYENFGILDPAVYDFDPPSHYGMTMVENRNEKWYQMRASAFIDIKPFEGFSWRTTFGGIMKLKNYNYYGERYDMGRYIRVDDILEQEFNDERNVAINSIATYSKTINKSSFSIMVGTEIKNYFGTTTKAHGEDFPIDIPVFNNGNPEKYQVSGSYLDPEKWLSYFSRLSYNFDDKYLFQANFRRDGCSNFGPEMRFGNFPSFSGGWRITNESFMESVRPFMDLKIRGGWGILGNASIDKFRYLSTVNASKVYYSWGTGPDQDYVLGAKPNSFPNKEVHWEEFHTTNIGFDLGLFRSQLVITADLYNRINKGMLIPVDLPFSSGYYEPWSSGSTTINSGEVTNKGIEITAVYHKNISGIQIDIAGNVAYNKNEVKNLYADNAIIKGDWNQFYTEAGSPMSYYSGLIVERLYQATAADTAEILGILGRTKDNYRPATMLAPGDFKYKDVSEDGKITDADKVLIGNPWPKWVYGLNIAAAYRGFDLTVFIQGVKGNDLYNKQKRYYTTFIGDQTPTKAVLDSWTADNPDTDIPRLNYKDPNRNFSRSSTFFVEKGDYLRLKNVQIGYTLPLNIQSNLHMNKIRIYIAAQNILTLTKYTGLDPEFSTGNNTQRNEDNGLFPQNKLYQIGFQLEF